MSSADAYRVAGPRAISGDWSRFWHLTLTLAYTDWKLRFFGSVLGYLWSLLRPLMLFGILYFVFSLIVRIGDEVENYPLVLLIGVMLFSYFAEVTGDCVQSVVDREQLVQGDLPAHGGPALSVALAGSFSLVLNLVAVAVFVGAAGVEPRLSWLLLPIPLLLLVASPRAWECWCPRSTCRSGTSGRSGRWCSRASSTPRRSSSRSSS